jgi:hypothetical protein
VGRKKKADSGLILALACGASAESAAQKTGLSIRTVYRRLADPSLRQQVDEMRAELTRRVMGMLTAAAIGAVKTMTTLQESATSESVRLGAARAILEQGCKLREFVELSEKLALLERRIEQMVEGALDSPKFS